MPTEIAEELVRRIAGKLLRGRQVANYQDGVNVALTVLEEIKSEGYTMHAHFVNPE